MKLYLIFFILLAINYYYFKINNIENFLNKYETYVLYIPERYKYIKHIMNKLELYPEYIKGYNTKYYNNDLLLKNNLVKQKWITDTKNNVPYIKKFTISRAICHLGHIKILKTFLKSDKEYALIFEDDIEINNNFKDVKSKINTIINNIPSDTDIIYLSYCFEYCDKIKKINNIFSHSYRPLCRHFYLVSKKGAEKIINLTVPMFSSGDRMIGSLIKNKSLISYNVNPDYLYLKQKRNINDKIFDSKLDNTQKHYLCM